MQKQLSRGIAHALSVLMLASTLFTGLTAFGIAEPAHAASTDSHKSIIANLKAGENGAYNVDSSGAALAKVFKDGSGAEYYPWDSNTSAYDGTEKTGFDSRSTDTHIYYGHGSNAAPDGTTDQFRGTNYYRLLDKDYEIGSESKTHNLFLLSEYTWTGAANRTDSKVASGNPTFNENTKQESQTNTSDWQGSLAQVWAQRFAAAMFTEKEQRAMATESVDGTSTQTSVQRQYLNSAPSDWKTDVRNYGGDSLQQDNLTTNDKVFFLSIGELKKYFKTNQVDKVKAAEGAALVELNGHTNSDNSFDTIKARSLTSSGSAAHWWLRSASSNTSAGNVVNNGTVNRNTVTNTNVQARPAYKLALSSVLFASTANNAKTGKEAAELGELSKVENSTSDDWKLTISGLEGDFAADVVKSNGESYKENESTDKANVLKNTVGYGEEGENAWVIPIKYTDSASKEDDEFVSAAIMDKQGNIIYYGHIGQNRYSQTASVTIPAGLAADEYKLLVFAEQLGGATGTDVASKIKSFDLTVGEYSSIPVPTANEGLTYTGTDQVVVNAPAENAGYTLSVTTEEGTDLKVIESEQDNAGAVTAKNAAENGEGITATLTGNNTYWLNPDGTAVYDEEGNYSKTVSIPYSIDKAVLTATYGTVSGEDADQTPKGDTMRCDGTLKATTEEGTDSDGFKPASYAASIKVTGFVNNETTENAKGYSAPFIAESELDQIALDKIAGKPVLGKTYTLTPSGGSADNYDFEYVGGILTVEDHHKINSLTEVAPGEDNPEICGAAKYWICGNKNENEDSYTGGCGRMYADASGKTQISEIETTTHNWDEGVIKEGDEPTCTKEGKMTYTCQNDPGDGNEPHTMTVAIPKVGHDMKHVKAVEATCLENGMKEHYKCSTCGKYFELDENGSYKETTYGALMTELGSHDLTYHEAVDATCSKEGSKAYYECNTCGKLFSDEAGKTEVKKSDVTIAIDENAHVLGYVAEKPATCTEDGTEAYALCSECGKAFKDPELNKYGEVVGHGDEIAADDDGNLIIPTTEALGHKWEQETSGSDGVATDKWYEASEAEDGVCNARNKFKLCTVCGAKEWKGTHVSELTHFEAKDASCTEDGNIEYWYCDTCKHYFSDENGAIEIELDATVIKGGHEMVHYPAVEATASANGNIEYWLCSVCGKYFTDENGETETTAAKVVIPATGSNSGGGSSGGGGGGGSTPATQYTATTVTALITALPAADKLTSSDAAAVASARAAYDSLSAEEKAKVDADVLKKLETAEATLKADLTAVSKVETLIAELPEYTSATLADAEKAIAARDAYNALTDAQKAAVDKAYVYELKNTLNTLRVKSQTVNKATFTASDASLASELGATTMTLGAKVKKIKAGAFSGTDIKTLTVKTKKLTKSRVKGSLKGSSVTKIKVKVGKAKINKKYVKKYKKIFTKKIAGKKVKVSR